MTTTPSPSPPPLPLVSEAAVRCGVAETMSPSVRRLVAANPGPFTYRGTGTFIIGHGETAIIDPGPALPAHIDAIAAALAPKGETIAHLVVTHTHLDHSPATRPLQSLFDAPSHGFGPHGGGDARRRRDDSDGIEEGADLDFIPDIVMKDGDVIAGDGWSLTAIHTPGHTSNHLCFALEEEKTLFTGDHVMGWSSTMIAPPDGDMGAYLASLERLLERDDRLYRPTHGAAVADPLRFVAALLAHRRAREAEILDAVRLHGLRRLDAIAARVYQGLESSLIGAAQATVHAHLEHLAQQGLLTLFAPPGGGRRNIVCEPS